VATHKSAIKRIKISRMENLRNRTWRTRVRTAIKNVRRAKTPDEARTALAAAIPIIDRTAGKRVIHKNAAARFKARLSAHVQKLTAPAA